MTHAERLILVGICGAIAATVLLVGTFDYRIAKQQEIERCECKYEIKERQLYASMCSSESIKGPIFKECLYK